MKKLSSCLLLIGLVGISQPGCKKNDLLKNSDDQGSSSAVIKDTLITGRNWYGGVIKSGGAKEYYAIHFNADSTLLWNELSGQYAGHWSVKDKHIKIGIPEKLVEFAGDLTDKNGITNISGNTPDFQVIFGQLLNNRDITVANTIWSGKITQVDNGNITPVQFNFLKAGQMQFIANGFNFGNFNNTGSDSTGVFRFNLEGTTLFGIFFSSTHIEGMQLNDNFLVDANKL